MKVIVIYKSGTGFTKKYAQWIAEDLNCESIDVKNLNKINLSQYDLVIYGSSVMANKLKEIEKIKKIVQQNLIIFGVGLAPVIHATDKIRNENLTLEEQANIPFYYFQGGIDYEKLGFASRKILRMICYSLQKKKKKTEEDIGMIEGLSASCDYTHKDYILPLIEKVKTEFL